MIHRATVSHMNVAKRLYRIREDQVRELALQLKYNPSTIPSLNGHITTWDPDSRYDEMNGRVQAKE